MLEPTTETQSTPSERPPEFYLEAIRSALQTVLGLDNTDWITPKTRLFEDVQLDSTASLELLVSLEDYVPNLEIDPETLTEEHFRTVGAMMDYVKEHSA